MVKDNTFGIADLQDKMLDILKYFIKICDENGLRYWAGGGTCLGALRHGGFIPWDDDLDIFMPRPDYERLYKIWRNVSTNKQYKLCRTTRKKNYHHRVMQIVDLNTTFINKRSVNEDIEHGVYIDIIPMDASSSSKIGQYRQALDSIIFSVYNIQTLPEFQGGKLMRTGTQTLLNLVKNNDRRYRIWKAAEKRMTRCNWETAEYAVELTTSFSSILRFWPRRWFGYRKEKFEDIEICVPSGAEEYMTAVYGDFMKMPPIEDQTVKHNTVFIDLDNPYTKYKGIYYCVNNEGN